MDGRIVVNAEAAQLLGISKRRLQRLRKAYSEKGVAADDVTCRARKIHREDQLVMTDGASRKRWPDGGLNPGPHGPNSATPRPEIAETIDSVRFCCSQHSPVRFCGIFRWITT